MKPSLCFLAIFSFCACSDDDDLRCKAVKAQSGYPENGVLQYDIEYAFYYSGNLLHQVETKNVASGDVMSIANLAYDNKGRITKILNENFGNNANEEHTYYQYGSNFIKRTFFVIVNDDTLSGVEGKEFFVENPGDKVYHDPFSNVSHKFENGNLIEFGSYEVSGADTTVQFFERYEYDNRPNHYKITALKHAIPGDFKWAKDRSKNNLVHAIYLGPAGGWDKTYDFQYDNNNNLKRYTGPTGITVDFEYDCK